MIEKFTVNGLIYTPAGFSNGRRVWVVSKEQIKTVLTRPNAPRREVIAANEK